METLLDPAGKMKNMMLTYAVRDGIINHCGEVRQTVLRPREHVVPLESITRPNEYEPIPGKDASSKLLIKSPIWAEILKTPCACAS